jgi:hypothetical protein
VFEWQGSNSNRWNDSNSWRFLGGGHDDDGVPDADDDVLFGANSPGGISKADVAKVASISINRSIDVQLQNSIEAGYVNIRDGVISSDGVRLKTLTVYQVPRPDRPEDPFDWGRLDFRGVSSARSILKSEVLRVAVR